MKINSTYKKLLTTQKRYRVLMGGAGSGKSYAATQIEVLHLLQNKNRLLCIRKVARTLRQSVYALFKQVLDDIGVSYTTNRVELTFLLENGSEIIMMGVDDPEKIKSIAGVTRIFIEEATELSKEEFQQIDLRLRGIARPSLTLCFNPIDETHWLKARFFDAPDASAYVLKTTYKDNAFIDAQYKHVLESLITQDYNYYRVYALGEWGSFSDSLIFPNFKQQEFQPSKGEIFGLDFGYSADPCALVGLSFDSINRKLYARELIYKHGLTNNDLSKEIKAASIPHFAYIYADSAEPKSIEELHRKGWNIRNAVKGKDSVNFGIDNLKAVELIVCPDSTNLIKELKNYRWITDKNGNKLPKPVDFMNHAIDAMRYAFTTHYARPQSSPSVGMASGKGFRKK